MIFFINLSRDDSRIGDTSLSRGRGRKGEEKVGEREIYIYICCARRMQGTRPSFSGWLNERETIAYRPKVRKRGLLRKPPFAFLLHQTSE